MTTSATTHPTVNYGDHVSLFAQSYYTNSNGGLIGVHRKKFQSLYVLSNLNKASAPLTPSVFVIQRCDANDATQDDTQRDRALRYGDPFVLVDTAQNRSWNNRTGVRTGYIGPRKRNKRGEMFVTFSRRGNNGSTGGMKENEVVLYDDRPVYVDVLTSNRHRSRFNQRVSNFKKHNSKESEFGGYIRSDGKGSPLEFIIKPHRSLKDRKDPERKDPEQKDGRSSSLRKESSMSSGWGSESDDSSEDEDDAMGVPSTAPISTTVTKTIATTVRSAFVVTGMAVVTVVLLGLVLYSYPDTTDPPLAQDMAWLPLALAWSYTNKDTVVSMLYLWCVVALSVFLYHPTTTTSTTTSTTTNSSSHHAKEMYDSAQQQYQYQQQQQQRQQPPPYHKSKSRLKCTPAEKVGIVHALVDEDGHRVAPMPDRMVTAEGGDLEAAKERWLRILKWRADNRVDEVLNTPQPHFNGIKQCYPHYFHKLAKNNVSFVYYSQPGLLKMQELNKLNITFDHIVLHNIFLFEYMWTIANPRANGKLVTIIDMKGLGFSQIISGPVKQLLKRTVKTGSEYYPERTLKTFIINVPTWFSMVWNIVKSFLTERSVAKISILKSNYSEELEALIPKENIPILFGGTCDQAPYNGALEIAMQKHVDRINADDYVPPLHTDNSSNENIE